MIPPLSARMKTFQPLLQALSMTPENNISNIESKIIQNVTTATTTLMLAHTRMGFLTFLPPDAQFMESTDTDV